MSTSTSATPRGVLPKQVKGVPVIYGKVKQTFEIPSEGPAVAVIQGKTRLYDEDEGYMASARSLEIIAYYDGKEVRSYFIRTNRWYSGKLRWFIVRRVKARIRRAVRQIT